MALTFKHKNKTTHTFMVDLLLVIDFTTIGPSRSMPRFENGGAGTCRMSGRTAIFCISIRFLKNRHLKQLRVMFLESFLPLTIHAVCLEVAKVMSRPVWSLQCASSMIRYATLVEPMITGNEFFPKYLCMPVEALPCITRRPSTSRTSSSRNLPVLRAATVDGMAE